MANAFDTIKFIQEVEKWPQLWNVNLKSLPEEQYLAWHRVGEAIFSNWKQCPAGIKESRVREMRILWKDIEEKYFQEISSNEIKGKTVDKYIRLLNFLRPCQDIDKKQKKGTKKPLVHKYLKSRSKKKKDTSNQKEKEEGSDEITSEEDGDESFFRSLLPAVRSLNEHQKMDFRLDILNSMKKIMGDSNRTDKRKSSAKPIR